MKFEEAKIGMRVGLCRATAKNHSISTFLISWFEQEYFPGIIVGLSQAYDGCVVISKINDIPGIRGVFRPVYLVLD